MPRRPQRPCSYPGCPNRCDGQYCEEHSKQMNRRYNKFVRPADSNKKYGRAWREIRKRYATAHPLCEICLKEGRLNPVEEVHHIVPVSRGGTNRVQQSDVAVPVVSYENTSRPRRPVGAVEIPVTFTADSGPGLRAQKSRFKRGIKP